MKNDESDSRPIILVVDDEQDFLDSVRLFLEAAGEHDNYQIITSSNPAEVAQILRMKADRLNMIVVDMHMPECSGLDVIRWIRAHPKLEQLPILMLSGDHLGRRRVAEASDPFIDFLLKPLDPDVLYHRIKRSGAIYRGN
jgi:two-component system, OmpR family, response regulator